MSVVRVLATKADGTSSWIDVNIAVQAAPASNVYTINEGGGLNYDLSVWLNAELAKIPDGTAAQPSIVQFDSRVHRVEFPVILQNRNHLDIRGFDFVTTQAAPYNNRLKDLARSQWRVLGGSDIKFSGYKVKGPNANGGLADNAYVQAYEAQHAFEIDGCQGFDIGVGEISYLYGDFVYVRGGAGNGRIHHVNGHNNGRQGVAIVDGHDIVVENVTFNDMRRSHIDLEPYNTAQVVRNVTIRNNYFGTSRLNFVSCAASQAAKVSDIVVDNNDVDVLQFAVTAPTLLGSDGQPMRTRFTVTNNRGRVPYSRPAPISAAMVFAKIAGIEVHGNTQPMVPGKGMYLMYEENCTTYNVFGNTVPDGVGELKHA